ncbi:MAG: hypothetical protein AAGI15_04085 [Pseudomonadota bacterium]
MPSILFLRDPGPAAPGNDNHERLPAAFRRAGWRAEVADHDSLQRAQGALLCGAGPVAAFDRVWCLGFGARVSFLDRMQLLTLLPEEQLVTSATALLRLHGKILWHEHMPPTFLSCDPGYLLAQTGRGDDWVLKPPAGAYGRDLYLLPGEAPAQDKARLLERVTHGGRYWILQRYLPQAGDGEKRVLFAGGLLLGSYLRRPAVPLVPGAARDLATPVPVANLSAGGQAAPCELAAEERRLAGKVADELMAQGVGFAAIDLVSPYLMEVNIANPGGLKTLAGLTDDDPADAVVAALVDLWR